MDEQDYYSLDNINVENFELNDDFLIQMQQYNNLNNTNLNLNINFNNSNSNDMNDNFNSNYYLTPPLSNDSLINNPNANCYPNDYNDGENSSNLYNYILNNNFQEENQNILQTDQTTFLNYIQPFNEIINQNFNNNLSSYSLSLTEDESTSRSSASTPHIQTKNESTKQTKSSQKSQCSEPNEVTSSSSCSSSTSGEKPPQPYADIIVRAILSTNENQIQLKDIYKYMIENYEYFANQAESNKWRNSVRHNLSRHKYFQKTTTKNSQGYFWSIHPAYIKLLKNGSVNSKDIKKLKINSEKPKRMSLKDKSREIKQASVTSSTINNTDISYNNHSSSTPVASSKIYNNSTINIKNSNDSAYHSFNETDNNLDRQNQNNFNNKFRFLEFSPSSSSSSFSSSSNSMYQYGVTAYNLPNNYINGQYNNTSYNFN